MRTTITIEEEMLEELMKSSKKESAPKAILEAVKWYLDRKKKDRVLKILGKVDLEIDPLKTRKSWDR